MIKNENLQFYQSNMDTVDVNVDQLTRIDVFVRWLNSEFNDRYISMEFCNYNKGVYLELTVN